MTGTALRPARLASIDGIQYLRAIAAMMVVGHHARHYFADLDGWSSFGDRGVDIFFVISGFIMAHSTATNRLEGDRLRQAAGFMWKRFVRVVPLYWLALAWTAKRELLQGENRIDLLKDFAFVPHFHAIYTDGIYPRLVPGWTINYEMFFYALFALSMLFGRWRYAVLTAALATLVGLGGQPWTSPIAIFYTSSLLIEFALGVGVYFVVTRMRSPVEPSRRWLAAAVTAVGFGFLALAKGDAMRGLTAGPAAALIVASTVLWAQGWRVEGLRRIGDASYSIYLFHLASFWIPTTLLHRAGVESVAPWAIVGVIAAHLVVAVAAGLLIYRLVERPILDLLSGKRTLPGWPRRSPSTS